MKANKQNLGAIFDGQIRFVAPLFQRPYVWTEDKNWEPLWEAVSKTAQHRVRGDAPRPYFLGALVLDQLPTPTGYVEARQIIDGQQRLTTLQIFLTALRHLSSEMGSKFFEESFRRLTENHVSSAKDGLLKVEPTNADRIAFHNVMQNGQHISDHLFFEAYGYFRDEAEQWLQVDGASGVENRLRCLETTLRQDILLVVIDLDENDEAQLIFETLNALGEPLLPADLVKNLLFYELQRPPRTAESAEEQYRNYWKKFDDGSKYWRKEIRQGRLKRPRVDLFLNHYLVLKTKSDILVAHLFAAFKDYFQTAGLSVEEHVKNFKEYSDVFESFESFQLESREGLFFKRLNDLDTSMVLPVLLEAFRLEDRSELFAILDDIESYLARRAICGFTKKNYNNIFIAMVKWLSEKGFSAANVRSFLLSRTGESTKWPTDEEIEWAILNLPIYRKSRPAALVMLKAYERSVKDPRTENVIVKDEDLSIEHVMPQEWKKKWPIEIEDEALRERAVERREALLHTIGNLTLITGELNKAQSNKPWSEKKIKLQDYSALAMNRQLCQTITWDEAEIRRRGSKIYTAALKIWSRPASPHRSDAPAQDGASMPSYVVSRNFLIQKDDDFIRTRKWFNMWQRQRWPYETLSKGDIVFFLERPSQKLVLKGRVTDVYNFPYTDKSEVISKIEKKLGKLEADEATLSYVENAPEDGFCLSYTIEPLEWMDRAKPKELRFPQLGWARPEDDELIKAWIS